MSNVNGFWNSVGQIALAAFASWGSTKLNNNVTSWVPYRNQMAQNLAVTAISEAMQQFVSHQQAQPTAPEQPEQPTQQ